MVTSRAALVDHRRGPDRHLRDLAFLSSLVSDPFEVRDQLNPANRTRLSVAAALDDENHIAWVALGPAGSDAFAARTIITATLAPQPTL